MPNKNYTLDLGTDKPSLNLSDREKYLTVKHGDLHGVIPPMLTDGMTLAKIAAALSDDVFEISLQWVHQWLRRNGYRRVTRWHRNGGAK